MKDLIIRDKNEVSISRRKKRNRTEQQSIFEIYKSSKTIKDYLFYLKDFLNFIYEGNEPISSNELIELMVDIEKNDVEDYLGHLLNERNLKKTSVNKIISALKSLYKELEKNGYDNPFKHIEHFKVGRNIDNVLKLSFEDIKNIIQNYRVYGEKEYRNIIILYTLFYTGIRSQELLSLQFKHILERDGEFFLKLEKTKSGKEQYKPLHNLLVKKVTEFKEYLKKLYLLSEEELNEHFIFCSSFEKNKPLSYRALYSLIQEMGKVVSKDISPHNIRHAIATELSLNGADILEIRDFLGHSDTRVTEIYINAKSLLEKRVLDKIPIKDIE